MAEIGVERFRTGHREEYRTQRHQPDHPVAEQEGNSVVRIERGQHAVIPRDPKHARHRNGDEPHRHDRTEEIGDAGGAARLHRKQDQQDRDGQRHDVGIKSGRHDLQAFDRGKHRDCRRDERIAEEQRGTDDAERRHQGDVVAGRLARQRHQSERAAFAIVVGAQQHDHIFEGDDENQRPQDQRQHAQHRGGGCHTIGTDRRAHRLAKGVKRAGADVAVNDADAADGEAQQSNPGIAACRIPSGRGDPRLGSSSAPMGGGDAVTHRSPNRYCAAQNLGPRLIPPSQQSRLQPMRLPDWPGRRRAGCPSGLEKTGLFSVIQLVQARLHPSGCSVPPRARRRHQSCSTGRSTSRALQRSG